MKKIFSAIIVLCAITLAAKAQSHEGVYMGGGLTWATTNIGADSETANGNYYAWSEKDIAAEQWGGEWRTPTHEELLWLTSTSYTWEWDEARNGWKITYKYNGNSIFLPAAGYYDGDKFVNTKQYGKYWSSVDHTYIVGLLGYSDPKAPVPIQPNEAYLLLFGDLGHVVTDDAKSLRCSIRAVKGEINYDKYREEGAVIEKGIPD